MAEYVLIDGYLDAFRTQVRWRRDVEDLVAEVEDHLYSTVERFEARGTTPSSPSARPWIASATPI